MNKEENWDKHEAVSGTTAKYMAEGTDELHIEETTYGTLAKKCREWCKR